MSAAEAAGERGNGDVLGEGGVPAGLELGVVGDCIFSHCTMDGRGWLGLRIHLKDRINTMKQLHNGPRPKGQDTSARLRQTTGVEFSLNLPRTIPEPLPKQLHLNLETLY